MGVLIFLESLCGQAGSARAFDGGLFVEVQEVRPIPPKYILMQRELATAAALQSVIPALVLEVLRIDRVERHESEPSPCLPP